MKLIRLASFFLVLGLAAPAVAADEVTRDDIAAAREARREAAIELEASTDRFETAVAEEIQLRESIQDLAAAIAVKEQEVTLLRAAAADVARDVYMSAGSGGIDIVFGSERFTDIPVRATYVDMANSQDQQVINRLAAVEAVFVDQQTQLEESLVRQRELVAAIEIAADEILTKLEEADTEYLAIVAAWEVQEEERRRREEEARRRREAQRAAAAAAAAAASTTTVAPTPTTTLAPQTTTATTTTTTTTLPPPSITAPPADEGSTTTSTVPTPTTTTTTTLPPAPAPVVVDGRTCPVDGAVTFSDSWGAARSGGRTHKGVDVIAARNTRLVAIESGGIYRLSTSSLGGISIYLVGNSGDLYYYAHLEAFAEGLTGGQPVTVGEVIGFNGSSGNAPNWLPHLHFQWKPAGSADWVNPYPLVDALCR